MEADLAGGREAPVSHTTHSVNLTNDEHGIGSDQLRSLQVVNRYFIAKKLPELEHRFVGDMVPISNLRATVIGVFQSPHGHVLLKGRNEHTPLQETMQSCLLSLAPLLQHFA